MKRVVLGVVAASALALLVGVAFAQTGWGPGGGWGPGMMGRYRGGYGCGDWGMMGLGPTGGPGWTAPQTQVTDESAKQLAQQYADQYLKGFTVDKVLPFTGMGGITMYQAELKGPKDEVRTLHINPWGNVMPFGGPWQRG
jgi:hypothetical protein